MTLWEVWSDAAVPYWEEESDKEVAKSVVAGRNLLERPDGCSDAVWGVTPRTQTPNPQPSSLNPKP